ncbi:adenine-specific methyltransferase EcoRI family protein [Photobacterium leiognathi]|uniref:adenine-specific methyltransferase EcoRI family protein n=1 Tax=Photobacterium leiognathi TaxID=553611 RepID=UPI000769C0E5|nr:adenine-specific methyltransferase EcoRI family protein [Photobacterium leiognathi]ELI6450303.1 adenine-specific methyltransferase EcoRI family protein [Photobacterium damselae]
MLVDDKKNKNNTHLNKAKKNKKDEFYTQLVDIESELKYYEKHFKNKVVYCNCDDPRVSNFYKYFKDNFEKLGLKKLIVASYKSSQSLEKGFYFEYFGRVSGDFDYKNANFFDGDGDFRSQESIRLLEESDIIVTNPPFSLFRQYVEQLDKYNKKYLIIGNVNAITYKEIFKLIQNDKAWLGINLGRGVSGFIVPEHYELYGTETRIDENGNRIVSPNNCLWLTNLDIEKRHEDILLTKKYYGHESDFPSYDNYQGINVNKTKDIPMDYKGAMGVPITFLHKYNPEQFEIIKFRKGNDEKDLSVNGKCPYFRILIRNKRLL